MRKTIRRLFRGDRRRADATPIPPEPQAARTQHVPDGPAVAAPSVQEPAAQPAAPPTATSLNHAVLVPENPASVSEDLWLRAYRDLAEREPELVKDYEKHIGAGDGGVSGALSDPDSVQALVKSLQEHREKSQWKFSVRSKDHKVSDQLEKLVKLLALADGVVKPALASQPYAALAWSTVSVFVPLLSDGFANNMAMVKGFTTIGQLQRLWKNHEEKYLRSTSSEHYKNHVASLSNFYSYMLEYQVCAVCHLSKKQLSRAWRKVAGDSDWSDKAAHVDKMSDTNLQHLAPSQREEMAQYLASQNEKLDRIGNTEENILRTMKDHWQKDSEIDFLQALKSTAGNYKGGMEFNPNSVKGTCEWFFTDEKFSTWRDSADSGVFWLTAGPGCGKSVLARTLIEDEYVKNTTTTINFGSSTITSSAAAVCYFFFKEDDVQRTKITTAFSALLHQLFLHESTSHLIEHALPAYRRNGSDLTQSFEDLWSALITCAERLTSGDIVCVLDALDECSKQSREQLIGKLESFYNGGRSAAKMNLKFLITSRPYDDIERCFWPLSKRTEYFRFDADERHDEISHDIGLVIDTEMESFASDFNETDRQKIAETLKAKGTKTYLWLHLTLRILKADPSQYSRRRDVDALLAEVPTQVSEAYEKILNRTKNEKTTSTLLQIILAAARPLKLEEVNYALTLALEEDGFETHAQLEEECWKDRFKTIVKNFSGLIISVYDDKLSFIHLTAQEYLVRQNEPGSPATKWGGRFANGRVGHGLMFRCCLQYLLLPDLAYLSSNEFPLLEYAACYWPEHFARQDAISEQSCIQQARRLCKVSAQPLKVWGPIYRRQRGSFRRACPTFFGWTDLTVAAHLGLSSIVKEILNDETIDVNEQCAEHGAVLSAAVSANDIWLAKLLITRGADVNMPSFHSPPLLVAAKNGNGHMLSLLLENGASLLPALQEAARRGMQLAFQMLVSAAVDISTPDKVLAALTHESIVQCGDDGAVMLLDLVLDDQLGDVTVLTKDLLGTLLDRYFTRERIVRLIVEQKKQDLLLEPAFLSSAISFPEGRQVVRSVLQEHDVPCVNIQQVVLEDCVMHGDAETLRTLIQYCPGEIYDAKVLVGCCVRYGNAEMLKLLIQYFPEGICDVKGLLRAVILNTEDPVAISELVVDIAGELFFCDQELQEELLKVAVSRGTPYAFLRLPRLTIQVARRLIQIILRRLKMIFSLDLEAEKDMVARILDRCTDKSNVINATLLTDAARHRDRETVLWLLELSGGGLVTKERLLEAAAANEKYGEAVIEALLQGEGAATVITPCAVLAAAGCGKDRLDLLLRKQASKVARTAELTANADRPQASETLAKYRDRQVAELALLALRMAVEDRSHHVWAIMYLIPHCAGSLIEPTEDFILDSLEGGAWQVEQVFLMLVATVGNGMVLTERILARVASCHQLLEMVRDWRPSELKVTPSLIAMIAAGGHTESLDYLAKCDDELTIGAEWYRLARLRSLIQNYDSPIAMDGLKALWEGGYIPDVTDANGMTALHAAAGSARASKSIPFLVDVAKFSVDAADRSGWTALHHAVRNGSLATVQALILAGADPHKADYQGRTPVTMAQGCETCKMVGSAGLRFEGGPERYMEPEEVLAVLNGDFRAVKASGRGRRGPYWSL